MANEEIVIQRRVSSFRFGFYYQACEEGNRDRGGDTQEGDGGEAGTQQNTIQP